MFKKEPSDLLPWILGALLVAVAVPAIMAFTSRSNAIPETAATAPSVVSPAPTAMRPASLPADVVPVPSRQPRRIWQCISNGQKIFSDTPCGADASVRQVNEINRMDAEPVARMPSYPAHPPSYDYAPAPSDRAPDVQDVSSTNQIVVIDERERRQHAQRVHQRERRVGLAHD